MAEIIGATASVITLASLFKGCIDAFDLFKCAKNQDADLRRLNLKLNIQRCRLLIWGQSVGLANDSKAAQSLLSGCAFQTIIEDSLRLTIQLLTHSEDLARKYGCRVLAYSEQQTNLLDWESETPSSRLNAAFDRFKSSVQNTTSRAKSTTKWVVHDRKKFALLINEARDLISGLQDITKDVASKRSQDRLMTTGIVAIHDPDTLMMISQVCDSDHAAFSDAASCRLDALSESPSLCREVRNWNDQTQPDEGPAQVIQRMEEWTIADLRRNYLDLLQLANAAGPRISRGDESFVNSYPGSDKFPASKFAVSANTTDAYSSGIQHSRAPGHRDGGTPKTHTVPEPQFTFHIAFDQSQGDNRPSVGLLKVESLGISRSLDSPFCKLAPKDWNWFRTGRVFAVQRYFSSQVSHDADNYGTMRDQEIFSKVLRVIVIKAKKGFCLAVPILTYTG